MRFLPTNALPAPLFKELNIMPFIEARNYKAAILIHKTACTNIPFSSSYAEWAKPDTSPAKCLNLICRITVMRATIA